MTKRTAGDLTESSLGSSKFRRRLRGASIRNRVHNNHSAEKKTGSRKRRYAPVEMEHKRTESKHQADGSITLYETRGVRDSTTFSFSNLDDTLSLGNHTGRVDADTFASLFEAANIWLRKAKEKDFFETSDDAEIAKQSVRTNKQRARVGRSTFQRWWFEIGMKHGFLSPSAIAANFLTASDFVHQLVKGNDAAIGAMIAQILLKGGKRLDKAASDAATEDYLDGIEDVPAWSVREAIRKWNRMISPGVRSRRRYAAWRCTSSLASRAGSFRCRSCAMPSR